MLNNKFKYWEGQSLCIRLNYRTVTTEGHIAALERRHRELERQIDDEMTHISHDDMMIAALKRKKLEIKDELTKLQGQAA
jgi:hypothetical protein